MQNKTAQPRQTAYANRAAGQASTATRPRTANAGAQSGRRPSGFAPTAPEKRRAASAKATKQAPKKPRREKPLRNKRTRAQRPMPLWTKLLMIGLPALILLIVILALIFGGGNTTYHQLPRVVRGSSSAFEPDETGATSEAGTSEAPASAAFGAANDAGSLEGIGGESLNDGAGDPVSDGFFSDTGDAGDATLLNELIALEGANS